MSESAVVPTRRGGRARAGLWRFSELLALAELGLATLGLAVVMGLVLLQAGARVGLDLGLAWPGEASRYVYIWSSFLGGAAAVHWKEEIRVDVLTPLVARLASPGHVREVVAVVQRCSAFIATCVLAYLAWLTWDQIAFQRQVDTRSLVMQLPLWFVTSALFVTALTGCLHYVAVLLHEPLPDEMLTGRGRTGAPAADAAPRGDG